jgi:hypothetical protein
MSNVIVPISQLPAITTVRTTDIYPTVQAGITYKATISQLVDTIILPYFGTTSGSANTYILTLSPALSSYTAGLKIDVIINATNTTSSTININGIGAVTLKVSSPISLTNLNGGELIAGNLYTLIYNGTNFQVMNPSSVACLSASVYFAIGGGGQVLPGAAAETKLAFDTVEFDPFSMWDATNHRFNILKSGKYRLNATVISTASLSVGNGFWITPFINNISQARVVAYNNFTITPSSDGVSGTEIISLTIGDFVDLRFHNDSNDPTAIASNPFNVTTFMNINYLGN